MYTTLLTLEQRNTVTGSTPNWMNSPQLGYFTFTILFYGMELSFLNYKNSQYPLDPVDNKHCKFLQGMIQIYCDLSSSDEPDIFDIAKEQKHILNQLIHFASKNWDKCKKWYTEQSDLVTKKNSTKTLVIKPWKNRSVPIDYVNDVCAEIKLKSQELGVPCKTYNPHPVYKNNRLHLDLFLKHHDRHIGFGFFTGPITMHKHSFKLPLLKLNPLYQSHSIPLPIIIP